VFPGVRSNYKHSLVKAARHCDHVFAVGDYVVDELRFLDRHFDRLDIDLVYNGIPARSLTLAQRQESRGRMQQYAANLFGYRPEWVFTHVARPVRSKGLWRDLRVLDELEPMLSERDERAGYFMLGTLAGQRKPRTVRQMERVYGWPVAHEVGYPDLAGGEEDLWHMFDAFNRDHENIRVVLVNQWDWRRELCGLRMPEDMTFADIRMGTDVEFGLSIYEPYGISQYEALSYGSICIVSNVCGCLGFSKDASGGDLPQNVLVGDFVRPAADKSFEDILAMSIPQRDAIEAQEVKRIAEVLYDRLPRDEKQTEALMNSGYALAAKMNWEHVVTDYFLPALDRAAAGK